MDDKQVNGRAPKGLAWRKVAEFTLYGGDGVEVRSAQQAILAIRGLHMPAAHLARIRAAVERAALEANQSYGRPERPLRICVRVMRQERENAVQNGELAGRTAPSNRSRKPASQAAGAPHQSWGFFLIGRRAKGANTDGNHGEYTIELFLYPEGSRLGDGLS